MKVCHASVATCPHLPSRHHPNPRLPLNDHRRLGVYQQAETLASNYQAAVHPPPAKRAYGQFHPGATGKNSKGKPFYTAPCWPTKTTPLYPWSNTEKYWLWLCYAISVMTKKILFKYPTSDTKLWRAVCQICNILCAHRWKTKVYINVSGVCTTTSVCACLDSSFDRQLCVCTMWTNIHHVHPSCVLLKVQPHCYHSVPTPDTTFTSPVALSKPQDIYIYIKCQEVSPHGSQQSVLKARSLNENKVGKNDLRKSIIKGLLWKQTVVHS